MLERAKEAFIDGEFFHEFIPVPDDLIDDPLNAIDAQDNQTNYGYCNAQEFSSNEWGTSADVSGEYEYSGDILELKFDSDAPPVEAYRKLTDHGFEVHALYYSLEELVCGEYHSDEDDTQYDIEADESWIRHHLPQRLYSVFPIIEDVVGYNEYE